MRKTLALGISMFIVFMVFASMPAASPGPSGVIFHAHFDSDTPGSPPDTSLPGPPAGDSIALNEPAGYILVQSAVGDLTNQPVEVVMTNGTGGVDLLGTVAGTPPTSGVWTASWKGLVQSGNWTYMFAPMVIRDSSNLILAAVAYREAGEIDFNDMFTGLGIGVTYTPGVSQYFELVIDMDAKTTSLSIDGVPVPLCQNMNFYETGASDLAHMNFEVGYTTAQAYALDDLKIEGEGVEEATIDIDPNTLNLKSKGKWITCYIELTPRDAYKVSQGGVSHYVTPVERATNDADYYDYWSASAHTEFVEPYVSKMYLYTNTLTDELSFFVHHNIDSTPPHIGSSNAQVDFDFVGLPAGVTSALTDDNPVEFDLTRPVEGAWHFWYNTDGGVVGDLPTDSGWSFSIYPDFYGPDPMTSWVYVDGDGTEYSFDMTQPVTISRVIINVESIVVSTVAIIDINGNPVNIPAESHPTGIGDEDGDGIPDLMVKFDRSEVQDVCVPGDATITVQGELIDGTVFEGSDTIRIIDPP